MESFRGLETQVLKPRVECLKPRSWKPGPETSHRVPENPGPESQVLKPRVEGMKPRSWNLALRSWNPGLENVRALLIGWSN
jgi:hypothetical protein